jgi:signal transduction histidine kinase
MRERLRQLGGTLDVQSNGEGKGMTVIAVLPAEAAPPPMETRSAAASSLEASA